MADQDPINPNNGQGGGDGSGDAPHAAVIAQYIKDLSVESPNSPQVFQWQVQPQVDVQFNINVDRVGDDVHEVALRVNISARSEQGVQFLIDLSYAGLFGIRNFPEDALGPFLLVEAPRLLFPFARQIIADAVQNTGFPPLLLEPIDFASIFMSQLEGAQQQQAGNGDGSALPESAAPGDDNQA